MMCYKACVRTKVSLFRAREDDINPKKRLPFEREAKKKFKTRKNIL